jgi:virulence factor Mce-like protein
MKRALIIIGVAVFVIGGALATIGAGDGAKGKTYKVVFDNAFGLVKGADFKVGGVAVGSITDLNVTRDARALVTVQATKGGAGFAGLRDSATCTVRPQSLIGEYFVDCQPGLDGDLLKSGTTIGVDKTTSPIPPDLVLNIMRRPVAERFSIIFSELGAGFAARGDDVNQTIRRAIPALQSTDQVLEQLAASNQMLADLARESGQVLKVLGERRADVGDFVLAARDAASATADRRAELAETFRRFPGFLDQLTPTMTDLGTAARLQTPALADLRAAAPTVTNLLETLQPFSRASLPAITSLGDAGKAGRTAAREASSLVNRLGDLGTKSGEPAKNLRIILDHLDNRKFAIEPSKDSPGGRGYTGLEAPLQYIFDQSLSANTFDQRGYSLKINLTVDECSAYTTAEGAAAQPAKYQHCNQNLGPNQPAITQPDPSTSSARFAIDPQTSKAGKSPRSTLPEGDATEPGATPAPGADTPAATTPDTPQLPPLLGLQPLQDLMDQLPTLLDPVTGKLKQDLDPLLGGGKTGTPAPDPTQALLDYLLKP